MKETMDSGPFERDPKFYSELKQANEDLIKYLEANNTKNPHFNFTPTLQSYIDQLAELERQYPKREPGQQAPKSEPKQEPEQQPQLPSQNKPFSFFDKQQNPASDGNRPPPPPPPSDTKATETNVANVEATGDDAEGEDAPPPEPNLEKYEETDAKYSCRCKLYQRIVSKKDGPQAPTYVGCGELFVKQMDTPDKLHLIMRQDPDLRKVILNQVLTPNIPTRYFPKTIQFLGSSNEEATTYYIAKVKDDKISSELFAVLNSIKT